MRGTMTETSPGIWRLRVVVGYRPDGQPRQASRTIHGTRRAAQSALAKFVTDAEGGETPLVGNMTVAAYLDRWIEHVRAHRQPDTTRNYALRCKRYKQEFGSVRLDKLRSHHLDDAYRRWLLEGLSPATITSYHGVLSSALGQAVKWGLVNRSVAPLATLPTVEPRRMSVPDVETVRLLVTTAEESDPVLGAAIMLAALTGCRRGELLGLRWSDVERDRMILQVQRSVKREEFGRVLRVGPTKTHQARKIALDVVTLAVIDTHRQRAEGWAVDAGVDIHSDGYILTEDPTGRTPLAPDTLTHRFSRLVLQTGVAPLRFHDLRHSVATTLLAAGYDLAVVAGRLGHRDPTITLRVYAHALEQRDRQAANTLGALWAPPSRELSR
ncbi:MAG: site-specific integrase [Acidimicrobiales bacterium]